MNAHEPVAVYSASNPIQAEMIKNALEAEGIRSFLDNDLQAAMPGIPALEIRVWVPADQADHARKLIAEHESASDE